jgi:hypothetical protein
MIALRGEKSPGESRGCRRARAAKQAASQAIGYDGFVCLNVVLEASDEGGFTSYVPSLLAASAKGRSAEEAMANLREAVELYLEPQEG